MEIWKPIKGYEGLYEISNCGRVKSLPKSDGNGCRERFLKFDINKNNHTSYYRVTLSKDGKTKRYLVHRLVAETFIPNTENKPHINHIDFNGTNNCVENLEWVTHSENMIHSQKAGRLDTIHSKAGSIGGLFHRNKMVQEIESMKEKVFGSLKVIGYIKGRGSKDRNTLCLCLKCNNEYEARKELLLSGRTTMCKSCSTKEMHKNNEHIRNAAKQSMSKKVYFIDIDTNEILRFNSINEAAHFVNRKPCTITAGLKRHLTIAKKYKAYYSDDDIVRSHVKT